jgi:flagellar basal body-associated protein FliL
VSDWTLSDWLWIFVPLALVIAAYGIAFAVMGLRSRARRKARRAQWIAEKPFRDAYRSTADASRAAQSAARQAEFIRKLEATLVDPESEAASRLRQDAALLEAEARTHREDADRAMKSLRAITEEPK